MRVQVGGWVEDAVLELAPASHQKPAVGKHVHMNGNVREFDQTRDGSELPFLFFVSALKSGHHPLESIVLQMQKLAPRWSAVIPRVQAACSRLKSGKNRRPGRFRLS